MNPITNLHQGQNKVIVSMGYDSITTSVTLIPGHGTTLPDTSITSYNLVWWNASDYISPTDDPSVEIVKCIAKFGDMLIVMRSQQQTLASSKNIPGKLYNMVLLSDTNLDTNLNTLSYYNVPQIHGKIKHDVTTIDGGTALPIGQLPAHGIGAHTGTIGTWSNIDKTTSSIVDITTRSHTSLTDIGTNTHATIDTAILNSTSHIGASIAHGVASNIVGISDTQTLTNKTLTSPFISTIYGGSVANGVITIEGTSNATKTSSYVILQPTSGNVGIGTTIPTAKLHIGGTPGTDGIKFPNGTLQTTAYSIFTKGGNIMNSAGIPNAALNAIIWTAPFACTVTNVKGYRVSGTGAVINARKNGSLTHIVANISLTSADTWMDGGAAQNTAYAVNDKLEIMIVSTAGTVTQLGIQVNFTQP